jgi:hypothetical protein
VGGRRAAGAPRRAADGEQGAARARLPLAFLADTATPCRAWSRGRGGGSGPLRVRLPPPESRLATPGGVDEGADR